MKIRVVKTLKKRCLSDRILQTGRVRPEWPRVKLVINIDCCKAKLIWCLLCFDSEPTREGDVCFELVRSWLVLLFQSTKPQPIRVRLVRLLIALNSVANPNRVPVFVLSQESPKRVFVASYNNPKGVLVVVTHHQDHQRGVCLLRITAAQGCLLVYFWFHLILVY
jgi:hypothetical protein